jgi:hypothetical protein
MNPHMNATLAIQCLRQVMRRQHKALSTESTYVKCLDKWCPGKDSNLQPID